jgi:hypothetical protein
MEITQTIAALAALGTASYGLVDASKSVFGGVSNAGFTFIERIIRDLFPPGAAGDKTGELVGLDSVLEQLRANWINGVPLADQRSIAKSLIKLRLNAGNAAALAQKTGVDPMLLASVAAKMSDGEPLVQAEMDAFGRFDLVLTTALDAAYQKADQRYRNWCKAASVPVSVILAVLGAWAISGYVFGFVNTPFFYKSILAGLIATPLAPIAKDLSSAVQAGAKVAQALKK